MRCTGGTRLKCDSVVVASATVLGDSASVMMMLTTIYLGAREIFFVRYLCVCCFTKGNYLISWKRKAIPISIVFTSQVKADNKQRGKESESTHEWIALIESHRRLPRLDEVF